MVFEKVCKLVAFNGICIDINRRSSNIIIAPKKEKSVVERNISPHLSRLG